MAFTLPRRTVLKGLGGALLALPVLEVMLDSKGALAGPVPSSPKRYIVVFDGQSLGGDDDPTPNLYVPDTVGANYDTKLALQPLADMGLTDDVSVISGLHIPTASENGGTVPAGGRPDNFHVTSLSALLAGQRYTGQQAVEGVTSDQVVADAIGGATTFRSLCYRVQAAWYLSVAGPYGRDILSYKNGGSGNLPIPIPPTVSPAQAFKNLFYNFSPPTDPTAAKQADFAHRARVSVVDLVKTRADALVNKLGGADKQRIARHIDEIRDLEKHISALPPTITGACAELPDPGADPTLGGDQGVDASGNNTYDTNVGYSGEDIRAKIFCDLIAMAVTCDLTRVATLMITMAQSHLNMYQITGQATDCHDLGHCGIGCSNGTHEVSVGIAWHVKHFAYLVDKLKSTPEGAGTVLDNCALAFVHEGGHGLDPSSGMTYSSHSTENMACLVAGRAGGLQQGQHIATVKAHPAQVLITLMNAVDVPATTLGEVSGTIPGLLA
jgi:hypothetical protein